MEKVGRKSRRGGFSMWSLGRQYFEFTTPTSLKKSTERLQSLRNDPWLTQRRVIGSFVPIDKEQIVKFDFSRDANFGSEFNVSGYLQYIDDRQTAVLGYGRLSRYFYWMILLDVLWGIPGVMMMYLVAKHAPAWLGVGGCLIIFVSWVLPILRDIFSKTDIVVSRKELIDLLAITLHGADTAYFQTGDASASNNVFSRMISFYIGPSLEFISPLTRESCRARLKNLGFKANRLPSTEKTWEFFCQYPNIGPYPDGITGKLQQVDETQTLVSVHSKHRMITTIINFLVQFTVFAVSAGLLCLGSPAPWTAFPIILFIIVALGVSMFTVTKWREQRLARLVYNALSSELSTSDVPAQPSKIKR